MLNSITSPLDGIRSPFGPQRGFNPLRIFINDEPGVWFEANDANTLFTDVAGTTPVTTPGDAVALQLDKSQGLTLGPELVTNGTFDTDVSGWNDLSGWTGATFSSGTAVVSVTSFQGAGQALTGLTIGATYQIKATVVATTAPAARLYIGSALNPGSSPVLNQGFLPPGDYTFNFVATATSHGIGLSTSNGGSTSTWDNVSVRELPGNHRTQATTAARPLYALHPVGGVRNLLEYTEEFDNAVWLTGGLSDLVPSLDAPSEGPSSSFVFTPTTSTSGSHTLRQNISISGGITQTVYAKASGYNFFALTFDNAAAKAVRFDLSNGTVTSEGADVTGSIELIGDGWYRVSVTIETGCSSVSWYSLPTDGFTSFAGDGISGTLIAGAQLEQSSTATNYQRVGSFLDVSEEGKARRGRIWYNGTSHFMQTPTITPGTDKVQVFAGVRKLSDTGFPMVVEFSKTTNANNGSFNLLGTASGYTATSRGTTGVQASVGSGFAAPTTNILTPISDISGDSAILRIDGVQKAISTGDQGTGNYLAYPLYFGARAGSSLFFNGYEDTSIIRFGPNLDADTISKVESYVASKTPESTL